MNRAYHSSQDHDSGDDLHNDHPAPAGRELRDETTLDEYYALFDLPPDEIESVGRSGFTHLRCPGTDHRCMCGRLYSHLTSLIVAVDGACPGNGSPKAVRSACGVYLGNPDKAEADERKPENWAWRVPNAAGYAHTSQRAELHAALGGLQAARGFVESGGQWPCEPESCGGRCQANYVVIKSDSAYLVNGASQSLKKWQGNGWKTASRTAVKNRDLWEEISRRLEELKGLGAEVEFWLVPREMNWKADELANEGLSSGMCLGEDGLEFITRESDFVGGGAH
ncbi:ribonuclease H-like domain-containing protein [Staphylotrichum tortipilum]|uniref:ribonuclease H n=1 Tax=Staphylotrichum tortipilum TaxID=2831512 RepID=A0AAN6MIZ9_9PEZI|nr:ribonuclease H-like domain-containing protein [Staphylotrichum longicolle]